MSDHKPKIDINPDLMDEAVQAVDETHHHIEDSKKVATEQSFQEPTSDEYKDRWIRVTADFDNYRKRVQKEKTELTKFGNENLIRELLPVLDNFERALSSPPQGQSQSIFQGVKMIYTQLCNVLERFGLTTDKSVGRKFDPNLHEAVSHQETEEYEANTVIHEHQKMYFLHKKLIRPALVTVAKEGARVETLATEAPTMELMPDSDEN